MRDTDGGVLNGFARIDFEHGASSNLPIVFTLLDLGGAWPAADLNAFQGWIDRGAPDYFCP